MEVQFKHFEDADYDAVCAFLIALNREDRQHINWNWARFEWMFEHPEFDKSLRSSLGLWWCGKTVVGAALFDMYYGEAFCGVLPSFAALYPQVLEYADRALRDAAGIGVPICRTNRPYIETALAMGFSASEQTETVMKRELDSLSRIPLPAGYSLTEPDPIRDNDALLWLFWQGFDHGNSREAFEQNGRSTPSVRKHLNPKLGLAAMDRNGELASFCCLWYWPGTDYAYVEPVCTVPEHRGKGLAKSLLFEAMHRAHALGAARAYVLSDMPFYEKLGFKKDMEFTFYWKT